MMDTVLFTWLIQTLCITFVVSKHHVVKITPKMRAQGYHRDIALGEVIAEVVVDSPEECGRLCNASRACHSVMLIGQLCRMFAVASRCPCSEQLTFITQHSRYLIGRDPTITSFHSAMAKCLLLGAHSVHINSKEEHHLIKRYINQYNSDGVSCEYVWTGGWSHVSGSKDPTDWRWYYRDDLTGPSDPLTYIKWGSNQPNNSTGSEHSIVLPITKKFSFNDKAEITADTNCFLCECP